MKKIQVNIDGKEYTLTSDNEEMLQAAVKLLEVQLTNLNNDYKNKLNTETKAILAGLNIAENYIRLKDQFFLEQRDLKEELGKMLQQIEKKTN